LKIGEELLFEIRQPGTKPIENQNTKYCRSNLQGKFTCVAAQLLQL